MYIIMSSVNKDGFISCFLICIDFSLSDHIALARISSIILNRKSKSGHHCLISDIRKKALNPLSLSMILAVAFS